MKLQLLFLVIRTTLQFYAFVYLVVHALVLFWPPITSYLIFQNYINWNRGNLSDPSTFDLSNVHNFYLDIEPDVRIGIWHFIPESFKEYDYLLDSEKSLSSHFEKFFKPATNRPSIIYIHGSDRDRSATGRVELCQKLSEMGYHVFAIDFRGYGDSTGWPSEDGIVKDVMHLYNYLKVHQDTSKIFLWGHSLGSGVACHVSKVLSEFNAQPGGVILEAPFVSIMRAAREYIGAPLFLNNWWIIQKSEEALEQLRLHFDNKANIVKVKSKIMILHAEDDIIVSLEHSKELMESCDKERPKEYPPVKLVEISGDSGFGHSLLYLHDEIYPIVKKFIAK